MRKVRLGFKAYDLHELACHFVARHSGLYDELGLEVVLEDTRSVPDKQLADSLFSVACGSAAIRSLHGEKLRILAVATVKPMFWLYAKGEVDSLEDLRGTRIATYPSAAPPAHFLRILLEDAGTDPDREVCLEATPDDSARLERMQRGAVAAALISSAMPPHRMVESGFHSLLCVGDRIRLPTTGLAVRFSKYESDTDIAEAMRESICGSLRLIRRDETILRNALRESQLVGERYLDTAIELVQGFFTPDGSIHTADVVPGLTRLAGYLGVPVPTDIETNYERCLRA